MTTHEIDFYVRHRTQITEWARLEEHAARLMRDAVAEQDPEKALALMFGSSGDAEADFLIRNRHLITEWNGLQALAGAALHDALLGATAAHGCPARVQSLGWTSAQATSPSLDRLREEHHVAVEMSGRSSTS